mgnify:CR=1 FL=1
MGWWKEKCFILVSCFLCNFSRDTVKANVFGSHIAPPSMTLEEFGDQQKAEALERQAQQAEQGAAHANRR